MSRFEIKIVAALLVIAVIPLVASVVLVGQVIRASDSVARGQAQRLARPLERAAGAYRALFAARKRAFKLQGKLLALDPPLLRALAEPDREALQRRLAQLVAREQAVGVMALLARDGKPLARVSRRARFPAEEYRDLRLSVPAGQGGATLRVTFFTSRAPFRDFRRLDLAQRSSSDITALRDELSTYYRVVFLVIFGAVLLVATGLGLFIARRTARGVAQLASATEKVAAGDLDTRVEFRSHDEIGSLAESFNEMVGQLKESNERIAYLEKIGAWQEIARRLAHEIKNPLTPIQLAVQQLHGKYDGDDPRFLRLLDDARDIVTEEVDGLRRLVQAFSAFAKLPSVQPEPVDINALVDDFLKSHADLGEQATIRWTPLWPTREVLVDRMLIKHVLYNLVENAIHAAQEAGTPEQLQITLSARARPGLRRVELTVRDTGPGMAPDVARRVFDPYFTTKDRGTGLGLAIVKKIILEHRGSIVLTAAPGEGAAFVISLPAS